jgi:site-specific recombinase XerC
VANAKRTAALADQDRGVLFSDPKGVRVGEYLLRWLSNAARYQVSEGTYQRYERTCQNYLIPFFGRMKLRDLNAAHVRSFKVRKIEEGLNPNTVGVTQGVLSTTLNQAVDDNLIPSNPTARVKKAATRGQRGQEPHARALAARSRTRRRPACLRRLKARGTKPS